MKCETDTVYINTATPWSVHDHAPIFAVGQIGGYILANVHAHEGVSAEANAAFIVRAVNAHDELVSALKAVAAVLTQPVQYTEPAADEDTLRVQVNILRSDCRVALKLADQAITKAGGAR